MILPFVPATAQFRVLEETLIKEAIPYHIFGGLKFYGRKEIKDIMAYLRIIANPADTISAERRWPHRAAA